MLEFCPICKLKIVKPNKLVKYHIRYNKPLVIFACSYCNYTEFYIRTGKVKMTKQIKKRLFYVKKYHKKILNIK